MDEKCCVQCAKHQPKTEFRGKNGNLTATCAKCREYDSARKREKRDTTTRSTRSNKLPLARTFKHPPPSLNHHIGTSAQHHGMIVDYQQPSSKSSGSFISFDCDVEGSDGIARREAATSDGVTRREAATSDGVTRCEAATSDGVARRKAATSDGVAHKAATSDAVFPEAASPKVALSAREAQQARTIDN